ncbi:hypothetical protein [Xylanimonas protaetiae]|uniref:Uncharacterized protein n=1 Tax=Xylanimonas protaetiae TaxID=2509457 RepID=A0A4V0YGH2_9MICO|nr:hypothetical protein [Xylanimonas protaetiae]QAY71201.1 hypothetical protein ET471_15135 [Xylanimonas protaetiae]
MTRIIIELDDVASVSSAVVARVHSADPAAASEVVDGGLADGTLDGPAGLDAAGPAAAGRAVDAGSPPSWLFDALTGGSAEALKAEALDAVEAPTPARDVVEHLADTAPDTDGGPAPTF